MLNTRKFTLVVLVAAAMGSLAFRPAETWIKYTSAQGRYTIEFPGQATESNQADTTDPAHPFTIHYATYFPSDSEGYLADWIDMRRSYPANRSIQQLLEQARDGATKAIHATDVITTATVTDKEPYIAFAFSSEAFTGRGRIYIINKYQYSIITLFSINKGVSIDADKFIRSFKHL